MRERSHPYRSPAVAPASARRRESDDSDDLVLLGAIALVGLLGLVVGIVDSGRTIEPSFGILLLYFAVATYLGDRRARRLS